MTEFGPGGVRFTSYPFPAASVFPAGTVAVAAIRDADPDTAPPEVRLRSGETLFVPAEGRDGLRAFCHDHGIALVRRPDVWGALLAPFLDTEFTAADEARTGELLAAAHVNLEEVARLRARFGDAMVAYNVDSMLWDWVHLGLWDLLQALCGTLSGERHRLPPEEFATVYWEAMALADRSYDQNSSQA